MTRREEPAESRSAEGVKGSSEIEVRLVTVGVSEKPVIQEHPIVTPPDTLYPSFSYNTSKK